MLFNGRAITKTCSYCGMPTVVYDRVSQESRPDGVIPFRINQEQALGYINIEYARQYGEGNVPEAVKNLKPDEVRGIYVPYWLYSGHVRNFRHFSKDEKHNDHTYTYDWYMEVEEDFYNVPCDASKGLEDEMATYLEPFDKMDIEEFSPDYLSGFFAHKFDITEEEGLRALGERVDGFLERDFAAQLNPSLPYKNIDEELNFGTGFPGLFATYPDETQFVLRTTDRIYCLFPIYIAAFNTDMGIFRVLVNGSTGKVVGNVPREFGDRKRSGKGAALSVALFFAVWLGLTLLVFDASCINYALLTLLSAPFAAVGVKFSKAKKKYKNQLEQNLKMKKTVENLKEE